MKNLKHSGRRAFLKLAGGTALALPLLEFTHGKAWSQDATPAKRFVTVFSHGGTVTNQSHSSLADTNGKQHGQNLWGPSDPGEALMLGPIMQALEPLKQKLLLLQGVNNGAAMGQAQYGSGGHGTSNNTALTAADVTEDTAFGPSIDFVLADRLAAQNPAKFDRIHLTVSGHQYGSPYYAAANQRAYGEENPSTAFNTIFEGVTADPEPDPAFVHQQMLRSSVVDGSIEGYKRYKNLVSKSDQIAIEAHLEHLYALEAELNAAPVVCEPPTGINADGNAGGDIVGDLHAKLIVAALRCGLTNVANLEIADIITPWTDVGTPIPSAFDIGHSLHHYGREVGPTGESHALLQDWIAEMVANRQWRMSLFKQIAEGLDDPNILEGGKTLLDNSVMLYTSEFSNGSIHASAGVPVLLAGGGGGYFQTGRHLNYNIHAASNPSTLDYESNESTHNLFTSILHAFGFEDDHFGNAHAQHQGPLPGLTG